MPGDGDRPMKSLAHRSSRGSAASAEKQRETCRKVVLGSIPGLERLLPGRYSPGDSVRSRYGRWTLPIIKDVQYLLS